VIASSLGAMLTWSMALGSIDGCTPLDEDFPWSTEALLPLDILDLFSTVNHYSDSSATRSVVPGNSLCEPIVTCFDIPLQIDDDYVAIELQANSTLYTHRISTEELFSK
jgi:hypothetical protein